MTNTKYPRTTLPPELQDFRRFLYLTWQGLGLPDPTPRQYEIAWTLQHGTKRQIICALRGIGKSWIAAAFAMWCLAQDPTINVLILSASKQRADDFVQFCYRLMELPHIEHLKPRPGQRASTVAFDVHGAAASHAPSLRSQGITGQITGGRADVIIPDDIEVPTNSWTATMREKLAHLVTEFEAIIKPDPSGVWGIIAYLGTPHTQESLYWHLVDAGYSMCMWPAQYPADVSVYRGMLAPKIAEELLEDESLVGQPTDTRFDEEELRKREAAMGRTAFLMQFLLNTELSDEERYPLKLRDLSVMDLDAKAGPERVIYASSPEYTDGELPNMGFRSDRWQKPVDIGGNWVPYEEVIMSIDPSGRGADECAYVVLARLAGALFLLDWGGHLDGYSEETLTKLAKTAYQFKVSRIVSESNYGDGMWGRLFRPYLDRYHAKCAFTEEKVTGRKEDRMLDILEPLWQQHRIVVNRGRVQSEITELERRDNPGANASYNLFAQATHLCREKDALRHDDRLDALSLAAWWFSESLARSQDDEYALRLEEAFDKSLEEFIDAYDSKRGLSRSEEGWLQSGLS